MLNIELLKKLIFIADITQNMEPFVFDGIEIRLNTLLENSEDVLYALQVLKIPYTTFEPDSGEIPEEINVCFGFNVGLNVIYQITYVLKEIYGVTLDVYICYATYPKGTENEIIIGSYIARYKNFTNISEPIDGTEILKIDIRNIDLEELTRKFPNNNWLIGGDCRSSYGNEVLGNSDDDDFYEDYDNYCHSYENYGGYNGWSDDVIDDAFEGDPMNTWNVD